MFREALKEDDDGLLEASVADIVQREKRKRLAQRRGRPRLGMMRYTYVVIDTSEAMSLQDLKPTRFLCTLKVQRLQWLNCIMPNYLTLIYKYIF